MSILNKNKTYISHTCYLYIDFYNYYELSFIDDINITTYNAPSTNTGRFPYETGVHKINEKNNFVHLKCNIPLFLLKDNIKKIIVKVTDDKKTDYCFLVMAYSIESNVLTIYSVFNNLIKVGLNTNNYFCNYVIKFTITTNDVDINTKLTLLKNLKILSIQEADSIIIQNKDFLTNNKKQCNSEIIILYYFSKTILLDIGKIDTLKELLKDNSILIEQQYEYIYTDFKPIFHKGAFNKIYNTQLSILNELDDRQKIDDINQKLKKYEKYDVDERTASSIKQQLKEEFTEMTQSDKTSYFLYKKYIYKDDKFIEIKAVNLGTLSTGTVPSPVTSTVTSPDTGTVTSTSRASGTVTSPDTGTGTSTDTGTGTSTVSSTVTSPGTFPDARDGDGDGDGDGAVTVDGTVDVTVDGARGGTGAVLGGKHKISNKNKNKNKKNITLKH